VHNYALRVIKLPVGVLGASGYAGRELCHLISRHPGLELAFATANDQRGASVRVGGRDVVFVAPEDAPLAAAELVFSALPHGASKEWVARAHDAGARVVDLSSDLRPGNGCGDGIAYGLTEVMRDRVRDAEIVANPGCYATAVLLALAPLADAIDPESVVVDAKSGVSGAGRELKPSSHAGFVLDNVSPYRVGRHQHAPEIAQLLGFPVCFVPHLLPIKRGLIVTCYVRGLASDLRARLEAAYVTSHTVTVLPEGVAPELARVQGTDAAEVALYEDRATGRTVVICALDNLGKGAAGQAIQNANHAFGFSETHGLRLAGVLV
jgi:N-acetyl-gamma-glutamyl-phosphate reductase